MKLVLLLIPILAMTNLWAITPLTSDEKHWLKVVDPIITREERTIFRKRLTTSQLRAAFIELFWAKRDANPNDEVNPFRRDYMARFDYALAHFEDSRSKYPVSQRGYTYLLLGEPTKIVNRIDYGLMGIDFKPPMRHEAPELWIYASFGYGYLRKELRIQFLPTNDLGDFVGVTDTYTETFIMNFKNKLILHPEMTQAPLLASESEFSDLVDASGQVNPKTLPEAAPQPNASTVPEAKPEPAQAFSAEPEAEPLTQAAPAPLPTAAASPPARNPAAAASLDVAKPSRAEQSEPRELPEAKKLGFTPGAGNQLRLQDAEIVFKNDSQQGILFLRHGLAVNQLEYQVSNSQYTAKLWLLYSIRNSKDQVVYQRDYFQELNFNRQEDTKASIDFTQEIAVILKSDRYKVEVQWHDTRSGKTSYWEKSIEVPQYAQNLASASALSLLDPNVSKEKGKLLFNEKAYGLSLQTTFAQQDSLLPIIELGFKPTGEEMDRIHFVVLRAGERVKDWSIYPDEMTITARGTLMAHPKLSLKSLIPGAYQLRFELETGDGQLLTRELSFTLGAP